MVRSNLAILRTNAFDASSAAQIEALSRAPQLDVIICADERNSPVDTGRWPKVSLTESSLTALGLHPHPRAGWQCGDYFYYHVFAEMPGYDFYWLVEPDVLIDFPDEEEFFALFDAAPHDYLVAKFGKRGPGWNWHGSMAGSGSNVYGGLFPVSRLSARAIAALHQERAAASSAAGDKRGKRWPNDESFVGTTLAKLGMNCANLNAVSAAPLCTPEGYRRGDPLLLDDLRQRGSRQLYHPVLLRDQYLTKLRRWRQHGGPLKPDQQRVLLQHFGVDMLEAMEAIAIKRPKHC